MNNNLLLEASNITKSFSGVPVLENGVLRLRSGSVHALCGGNGAGKSTLLNILMGVLPRDSGSIKIAGQDVHFSSPKDAIEIGISMISQELEPVPELTVAENIFLGREPKKAGFIVDYRRMFEQARGVLDELNIQIAPTVKLASLSIAEMQMVEIAKAISQNARIIIMDEPTSAIGERETELLFEAVHKLKSRGAGIIYVSHRMNELFRIADDYTIMRDGSFVGTGSMGDIDRKYLIDTILGKELQEEFSKFNVPGEREILRVENYTRRGEFKDISLSLKEGEILGIFGLMGSGRSEFLNTLFGINAPHDGEAWVDGVTFTPRGPRDAMDAGMAYVTEDRKGSGLLVGSSIRHNISMASVRKVSKLGLVSSRKEARVARFHVENHQIKSSSIEMEVRHMSGGNQQKVVLAKWLQTDPNILMLDEPTRGIDVGAKREMYRFMSEFSRNGKGVIMTSSEIPEILGMSDRVIVFRKGRLAGELSGSDLNQDNLARLSS
ncbi:sugar ABC transporter ATP-binding protein [Franzmannia qiaohouensis]|uniref:Sugar ABC transporter ATP-binding protein n=1 Tax=Franzmannia qiaohouensis TaxID=1329370 RepID=A0ABU1HCV6_9GAMM|nr:sugar ABC transporter ATP-binding protein [Halomonas qiaohouensis]MDR5904455.1 sugar ABC transporter ATP-binding protein [Halomonas qiaohouensis]